MSVSRWPCFRRSARFMPSGTRSRRRPTGYLSASRRSPGAPSNTRPRGQRIRQRVARHEDHRRSHVQELRAREPLPEGDTGARIRRAHSFHHLQADRPRGALSHEVGVPYGIKAGNFYYDWLMVYGGIFPTFPDAEHGRTWLKPWDFKVVKQSDGEVTVAMSLKDDFDYSAAPKQFSRGAKRHRSDLLCHAESRSRRARCARGAEKSKRPGDPIRVLDLHDAGAGIGPEQSQGRPAAPKSSRRSRPTRTPALVRQSVRRRRERGRGQEPFRKAAPLQELADDGHRLCRARHEGGNFWGVINHDNEEGIIRIADNTVTPGLKMWTWGFPSFTNETDAAQGPEPAAAIHRIMGGRVGPVLPQRRAFPRSAKCRFRKPTARLSA